MRPLPALALAALCLALTAPALLAGTEQDASALTPVVSDNSSSIPVSQEFELEGSYGGGVQTKQGTLREGDVANINSHFDYVVSPQVKDGFLLRFGVDGERNSFSLPNSISLPNTLESFNAIIGVDLALTDKILFRAELHPGIYTDGTSISSDDIDVPVQFGATYLYSKDLQFILGGEIDLKSDIPFILVPGVRWQFADQWVLSLIPPKPQLQYELTKALTLYVGADIIDGTYHLNNQFGTNHASTTVPGQPSLNDKIVDFNEDRVGVGATWKFMPNLSLDVSTGYIVYREFDIHKNQIGYGEHSTTFHENIGDGAPYGEVGISGSF
jgi:hypothetical protein